MGSMSTARRSAFFTTIAVITVTAGIVTACAGSGDSTGGSGDSVTAPGSSGAIIPGATSLDWHECTGQYSGMKCASLEVPLDYSNPGGRKISIALSMVPATAPKDKQQGI